MKKENQTTNAAGVSKTLAAGGAAIAAGVVATWLMDKKNRRRAMTVLENVIERARQTAEDNQQLASDALNALEKGLDLTTSVAPASMKPGLKIAKSVVSSTTKGAKKAKGSQATSSKSTSSKKGK